MAFLYVLSIANILEALMSPFKSQISKIHGEYLNQIKKNRERFNIRYTVSDDWLNVEKIKNSGSKNYKKPNFLNKNYNHNNKMSKKQDRTAVPRVQRRFSSEERMNLGEFHVNQKVSGRIISIEKYGMFVDICSTRDGLVHVKDISRNYFVSSPHDHYRAGQDIDCYIKYVDPENKKIGLKMYPSLASDGEDVDDSTLLHGTKLLEEFEEGESIEGKVIRVSNFGVYVDVGCGKTAAFLHRRKMNIGKRRRKFTAGQIHPIGSTVKGYIYNKDSRMQRIGITTLPPEKWNLFEINSNGDRSNSYEETLDAETLVENERALENILNLTLDDDFEDEEEEEDALTWNDSDDDLLMNKSILSDSDISSSSSRDSSSRDSSSSNMVEDDDDDGEVLSVEDLFTQLANGKNHVTPSDMAEWDFISDQMVDGNMDFYFLEEAFRQMGAKRYKVNEANFPLLIEFIADACGVEEENVDINAIQIGIQGDADIISLSESKTVERIPYNADNNVQVLFDDFNDQDESSVSSTTTRITPSTFNSALELDETVISSDTSDYVIDDVNNDDPITTEEDYFDMDTELSFEDASQGQQTITYPMLLEWEVINTLLSSNAMTTDQLDSIIEKAGVVLSKTNGETTCTITKYDFEEFLDQLLSNSE